MLGRGYLVLVALVACARRENTPTETGIAAVNSTDASVAATRNRSVTQETLPIEREQAIQIAIARAKSDKHGGFSTPYVESVQRHAVTQFWVIKLLSFAPSENRKCAEYIYVTIDPATGEVTAVEIGGGA
jgi:hypothetical protein